jgi:hypothetical protein
MKLEEDQENECSILERKKHILRGEGGREKKNKRENTQ